MTTQKFAQTSFLPYTTETRRARTNREEERALLMERFATARSFDSFSDTETLKALISCSANRNDAEQIAASGLYETLQFPFSYLATQRDVDLVMACQKADMGFIAMKGLSGGLLNNAAACMAFLSQYPVLPIWGVQRREELEQWLSFFEAMPQMTDELAAVIERDRHELLGDFCRGCGYCSPCTVGIVINQCARMSQMVRRAPSADWLSPAWQAEMEKIDQCVDCGICMTRCPYELNIPKLLRKNLEDYRKILSGETTI